MEKMFKDTSTNEGPSSKKAKKEKPCRACYDFQSWAKLQQSSNNSSETMQTPKPSAECPVDKVELGRNTWSLLHTMAAYYPETPSATQQKEMSVFMKLFSKYYPCDVCAKDFRDSMKESPPETSNRWSLSQWLCRMHNEVNRKLGKEEFDCKLVDQRWRDGWDDGSCG